MLPIFIPLVFGLSLAAAPAVVPVVAPVLAAAAFTAVSVAAPAVAATAAVVVVASFVANTAVVVDAHASTAVNEPLEARIEVVKTEDGRVLLTSKIPTDECVAQAQAHINLLLPHASLLAGVPINVTAPDNVPSGQLGLEDSLAAWNGGTPGVGRIVIFTDFCRQQSADQRATIAHELGHAIDGVVRQAPPACSGVGCFSINASAAAFDDSSQPWETRRGEIAATAWALAIYQRADLPTSELESHFGHRAHDYWVAVQSYSTSHSK